MSELVTLLESLRVLGTPQKVAIVLDWAFSALGIEGAALFIAHQGPDRVMETRAALGSLTTTAPLLAAELSRTGIPEAPGRLPLPGTGGDAFFIYPLNVERGVPWSALVLHGCSLQAAVERHAGELAEASERLREMLETERASRRGALPRGEQLAGLLPNLPILTEGLRLPLYSCDMSGAFTYASPALLSLLGYTSLGALQESRDLFQEPSRRIAELAAAQRDGKVESYPLIVRSGSGRLLQIRDSAVFLGDCVFGMFFDVTGLLAANAELKDALQVQELLNDSILAGTKQLQRTQGAAIRALARLAEYRDPETGLHLQRICEYTRLIAVEVHTRTPYSFRITMEYANDISISSMLHDVGKVSTPDHILLKPGKLNPEEWETMKKHTVFGWEVLHKADRELGEQSFLTLAATIALSHHERFDGRGYPNGAAGEQIPLSARICAVADVYDALTSARPYKQAWSHERAVQEILNESGGHFDPALVEIFRDIETHFADVRRRFPG